jgi:ABC-type multidrug transport system fused ATPase/permease subunit
MPQVSSDRPKPHLRRTLWLLWGMTFVNLVPVVGVLVVLGRNDWETERVTLLVASLALLLAALTPLVVFALTIMAQIEREIWVMDNRRKRRIPDPERSAAETAEHLAAIRDLLETIEQRQRRDPL